MTIRKNPSKPSIAIFTTPCPKHGVVDRYKSGRCKMCQSESSAAWYASDPEKRRVARRDKYAADPQADMAYKKEYFKKNPEIHLKIRLKYHYNITIERYQAMLDACGGLCFCGKAFGIGHRDGPHVDHDHKCCPGQRSCGNCVRGLVCAQCNRGIGTFKDDPIRLRAAADYLEGWMRK